MLLKKSIIDSKMIPIEISDNGGGIDPEMLKHIFERDISCKKKRSSEIGLHRCANNISSMKGRLYTESRGDEYANNDQ